MAEVALVDVSKSFGAVEAVRGLSLSIADGEFVVLLGPTGAGKTTTLRLIAGLERPDRGNVVIQGRVVTDEVPAERDVAFVFQQYSLYPHLTVYDNLAFPLRSPARRMNEEVVRRRVQQVAELLHIEQKLGNRATALSGGEMQRVAIGRALVREPAVYLMDEPLSSLDAKLRAELRLELKRIQRELGTTILYVTHDQIEAMTMADRIGVMNEGASDSTRHAAGDLRAAQQCLCGEPARHTDASTSFRRSCSAAIACRRRCEPWACGPSISGSLRQIVPDRWRGSIGWSISAIRTTFISSSPPIRS